MNIPKSDERGDATTEAVLVVPALLLIIGLIINFALWYHASQIARSSAQEGVRAARVVGGTAHAGQVTAERFIAQLGPRLLEDSHVEAQRDATHAVVDVRATSPAVVPGLTLPVHARASASNETFTAAP